MKTHELHQTTQNGQTITYFYKREKRDINGNSRFRVYMIDSETGHAYERIFTAYEFQLDDVISNYIGGMTQ